MATLPFVFFYKRRGGLPFFGQSAGRSLRGARSPLGCQGALLMWISRWPISGPFSQVLLFLGIRLGLFISDSFSCGVIEIKIWLKMAASSHLTPLSCHAIAQNGSKQLQCMAERSLGLPCISTWRIGSRQQLVEIVWLVSLGCSGGAQQSCRVHLHIVQLGLNGKPLF